MGPAAHHRSAFASLKESTSSFATARLKVSIEPFVQKGFSMASSSRMFMFVIAAGLELKETESSAMGLKQSLFAIPSSKEWMAPAKLQALLWTALRIEIV